MFKNKLRELINSETQSESGNNKKKLENLIFLIVILIITTIIINIIWKEDKNTTDNNEIKNDTTKQLATSNIIDQETSNSSTNNLEKNLEEILSKIQGVGEVKVFINYAESSEIIPMYNESTQTSNTEETDTSGGTRIIKETDSQKEIIYEETDGEKTAITKKIVEPQIQGAIITAKGANSVEIKSSIIQAVEAVTGLATHKIQVFEMN